MESRDQSAPTMGMAWAQLTKKKAVAKKSGSVKVVQNPGHRKIHSTCIISVGSRITVMSREKNIKSSERERDARVSLVTSLALKIFGNDISVKTFMTRPHHLLNGRTPLEVTQTTRDGAKRIKEILEQIQYGCAL